ncbi:hypothetical protein [Bacillus infantis]|uniref:hypothetical protein n=1 Tax=Bacillus infantis TaxID=324767 RepID=UPI003CF32E29
MDVIFAVLVRDENKRDFDLAYVGKDIVKAKKVEAEYDNRPNLHAIVEVWQDGEYVQRLN